MKLELKPEMSFDSMTDLLKRECSDYKIKLLKNPVARFQYIQVEKSAFVGIWIRVFENKDTVQLINTMPSTIARIPLLGLIVTLFLFSVTKPAQTKVRDEVGEIFVKEYGTKEI